MARKQSLAWVTCLGTMVSLMTVAGSGAASAATILEPPLYSGLNVGEVIDLNPIDVAGPISGSYDLLVRYGIWNGFGSDQQVDITVTFDGTPLPTIDSTGAYFSDPEAVEFDVTSLVQSGSNSLSVEGIDNSGLNSGVGQYAVGGGGVLPSPLPATLPLFATGLGGLGLFGWRRKRKNATVIAA